jgi:hypothetical protein
MIWFRILKLPKLLMTLPPNFDLQKAKNHHAPVRLPLAFSRPPKAASYAARSARPFLNSSGDTPLSNIPPSAHRLPVNSPVNFRYRAGDSDSTADAGDQPSFAISSAISIHQSSASKRGLKVRPKARTQCTIKRDMVEYILNIFYEILVKEDLWFPVRGNQRRTAPRPGE